MIATKLKNSHNKIFEHNQHKPSNHHINDIHCMLVSRHVSSDCVSQILHSSTIAI